MLRRFNMREILWDALSAFLCGSGLTALYALSVLPGLNLPLLCAVCAACALFCALARRNIPARIGLLLFIAVVGFLLVSYFAYHGIAFRMVEALKAFYFAFRTSPAAIYIYGNELTVIFALFFTFLGHLNSREDGFATALLFLLPLCAAGFSLMEAGFSYVSSEIGLICILPVLASLLMNLTVDGGRKLSSIIVAAVLIALVFFLAPQQGTVNENLAEAAQDVSDAVDDYLFFADKRDVFSMQRDGWQPLEDRLGGPVTPSTEAVMQVTSSPNTSLYLRAKTYDLYGGHAWYDSISTRRYQFYSPLYENLKSELLDEDRPYGTDEESLLSVHIDMLRDGATTLFLPVRTRSITPLSKRMVLYFNDAGEVFLTRNLLSGDAYETEIFPLSGITPAVRALALENRTLQDTGYASATEHYLSVPDVQTEIKTLANEISGNLNDPIEIAFAIRDYLSQNMTYTLSPEIPPSQYDFVSYFLLASKEGYCVYYASAQTLLCRLCGIPARYAEGYYCKTDASGTAVLTGEDAHAWTEIYLNGVGWVIIDATPGKEENDNSNEQESSPSPSPSSELNRDTSPSPSPEPPDEQENSETLPSPEPQEENQSPSEKPEEPEADENQPESSPENTSVFPWILLLLLLLLLLGILLRVWWTDPERKAKRNPENAGEIYFSAAMRFLHVKGEKRRAEETLTDFAVRVKRGDLMLSAVQEQESRIYGKKKSGEYAASQKLYLRIKSQSSFAEKARALFLRFFGK